MAVIFIGEGNGTKASPSAYFESGHQAADEPDHVDDGLNNTIWWGNSSTAWLTLDLGSAKAIHAVRFAKPEGNTTTIQGSDNNSDWTTIGSVGTTGSGGSLEPVVLGFTDGPHTWRYWKFLDSGGGWPKITTIELMSAYTITSPQAGMASRISGILGLPNINDGDTATYWQTDGGGGANGWGGLDFGEVVTVNTVDFNCGSYTHDILGSTDGVTWDTLFSSVVFVDDVNQQFDINADYRFIRLSGVDWSAIREATANITGGPGGASGGMAAQSWRLAQVRRKRNTQAWK